jgi:hypothetical protein
MLYEQQVEWETAASDPAARRSNARMSPRQKPNAQKPEIRRSPSLRDCCSDGIIMP